MKGLSSLKSSLGCNYGATLPRVLCGVVKNGTWFDYKVWRRLIWNVSTYEQITLTWTSRYFYTKYFLGIVNYSHDATFPWYRLKCIICSRLKYFSRRWEQIVMVDFCAGGCSLRVCIVRECTSIVECYREIFFCLFSLFIKIHVWGDYVAHTVYTLYTCTRRNSLVYIERDPIVNYND